VYDLTMIKYFIFLQFWAFSVLMACQAPPTVTLGEDNVPANIEERSEIAPPLNFEPSVMPVGKFITVEDEYRYNRSKLVLDGKCQITMDFMSYSSGIPVKHALAAKKWLTNSPDVETVYVVHWGFEGETSYCAAVPDESRRKTVAKNLNRAVQKLGRVTNGYYGKAVIGKAFPKGISEKDILQSDKFIRLTPLSNELRQVTRDGKCNLKSNLATYKEPLNQPRGVSIREWMIRHENITQVYGIERSAHNKLSTVVYASLCANIPEAHERGKVLNELRDFLNINKHNSSVHLLNANGGVRRD